MWEFLKHLFSNKKIEVDQIKENINISDSLNQPRISPVKAHAYVQQLESPIAFEDQDNFEYGFSHRGLTEFEISMLRLKSYDGFLRQIMLEKLASCFDAEFFPHLLYRLSDYVPSNRQLAVKHIIQWSKRPEFLELCLNNFLDIAALRYRDRTDQGCLALLLKEVANHTMYLSKTLTSRQGKLPRVLLNFIIEYQWINESELLEMCRLAKDQTVRKHWLNFIIQHHSEKELVDELKRSIYKDVQYRLFDYLYQHNGLNTGDFIYFWQSKFASIMDYAYFALRQEKFNFDQYFQEYPINQLTSFEAKIRAKQWILLKGDHSIFFNILKQIDSPKTTNAIIFLALRQQYITIEKCLDYYHDTQQKLDFFHISKLKQATQEQITLSELVGYLSLVSSPITIKQRLSLTDGYGVWEQLYWFVISSKFIQTDNDKIVFDLHIAQQLHYLGYATYGEQWTFTQKVEMQTLLPAFIQNYPNIFEKDTVKHLLKSYLK